MSEIFKTNPIVKIVMVRGENGDKTKLSELQNDMTFLTEQQIITLVNNIITTGSVGNIDTGFVTTIKEQNAGKALQFWIGTQAEYNAIAEPVANMFYIVTDDPYKQNVQDAIDAINARIDEIEIPDIQAELSAIQTEIENFETTINNDFEDFKDSVDTTVETLEDDFCYKLGDTDTIDFRGCGYLGGSNYTDIYFSSPLRKILKSGLTIQINSSSLGIRYQNKDSATTWISLMSPTFASMSTFGSFATFKYTHSSSLWNQYTVPTVGISFTVSFTVVAST